MIIRRAWRRCVAAHGNVPSSLGARTRGVDRSGVADAAYEHDTTAMSEEANFVITRVRQSIAERNRASDRIPTGRRGSRRAE